VKNIAKEEGIAVAELETISGTGLEGRVTKKDILSYVQNRKLGVTVNQRSVSSAPLVPASINAGDEIIQMDRMRKMIAERMVDSKTDFPARYFIRRSRCDQHRFLAQQNERRFSKT